MAKLTHPFFPDFFRLPNQRVAPENSSCLWKSWHSAVVLFLVSVLTAAALGQPEEFNHPELEWRTIETEHFLVHFHQGSERTANIVAGVAEEIYPHITGLYRYEPSSRVEFIIRDTDDYSNGGAYFFDNKIEIWAENLDYVLRGTHNWLRDVVTHEFTHIVSLQKALKFGRRIPAGWLQIFGYEEERRPDVIRGFPNVLVSYPVSGVVIPVWFAEGVAQFQSPDKRFDYRDSHREMILRDRVIHNALLSLREMEVFGKNSIGNESAYNQGYAFVQFLAKHFGDTVVTRLAREASRLPTLRFDGVLKEVTGLSAAELYRKWADELKAEYTEKLQTVSRHIVKGEPFATEGIGNLFPTVSPSGKKLAYLSSGGADYLSLNRLVVEDVETRKKKTITSRITSSLSWSPDGRFLAYSRQAKLQATGSSYDDVYIYDLQKEKEYQITDGLRARNPAWSNDGKRLAFVVHSDGLTNLFTLNVSNFLHRPDQGKQWATAYYDLNEHAVVSAPSPELKKSWPRFFRKFRFKGSQLTRLTHYLNGRQIYHPRWAPDDSYLIFDTSTGFGRDIARISLADGDVEFLLNSPCDERYPVFDPRTGQLFYACDETGIFNIYSLDLESGRKEAHTNVAGGAFMPTVSAGGELYYALYENVGYKIYSLKNVNAVPAAHLSYIENYAWQIPSLQVDDRLQTPRESQPYRRHFSGLSVMPRLLLDYGTLKPGLYLYTGEILNRLSFFGGFDINKDRDLNLFALFDFRLWKHRVFMEFYNQTAHIKDRFEIEGYNASIERDVSFNLLEADLGTESKMLSGFLKGLEFRFYYTFSLYKAQSGIFSFTDPSTGILYVSSPFRYTYLRGHALTFFARVQQILPEVDQAINPRHGRYVTFKLAREWNRFLVDFATDRAIAAEVFDKFYFTRLEFNWEEYFPVPHTHHHSFTVQLRGGLIDRPVDDFFNFFAGGLVGLKGYPFYSIEGRKFALGSLTYRFPLKRNINLQILNIHFDKLYLGGFYQSGNAWNDGSLRFDDFKSDVGLQLRLDTFSWYFFPTRIFFEAVYPLSEFENREIRYKKEWRFYFGVLFDFNLRLEKNFRRPI